MRFTVVLITILLASTAGAATQKVQQPLPAKPAATQGLRGPVSAATKPAPISLINAVPYPLNQTRSATADNAACRRACSHTYFFCLQTEGAEDCPQGWSSCVSDCTRPPPPLRAGTE